MWFYFFLEKEFFEKLMKVMDFYFEKGLYGYFEFIYEFLGYRLISRVFNDVFLGFICDFTF